LISIRKRLNRKKYFSKIAVIIVMAIMLQSFIIPGTADAALTSNLTVTIYSSSSVILNWNDYLTNEKYYIVEKKVDSGAFQVLQGNLATNTTSTYDYLLTTGHTYTYRVYVIDSNGSQYLYTQEVTIRIDEIDIPNSLTVTPVSYNQIDLKWAYPNQKVYNTIIERKAESETSWYQIASVGIGQNTYSDKSVTSGIKYYYRVRAFSSENVKTAAYPDAGSGAYALLCAPSGLYGVTLSQYQIQLTWNDLSAETAFIIERKSPSVGSFEEIAVVPQNNNTYIDTNIEQNVTYTYRIKAVSGTTNSEYSDTISVTNTYLKPPGTLSSSCMDGKSVQLVWKDSTDNETGFEIWRKAGTSSDWELYQTMGRNATTFTDLAISASDTYSYKIRAKINDNNVYSGFSNITTVWSTTIAAPANLTYEVVGTTEIKLTWQDTTMTESGYKVERKTGLSGEWYTIAVLSPDTTSYNDKWINSTDVYFYRINVYDASNSVNYSDELVVSLKKPEAPTELKATPISSSEVQLTWKDNSFNENEFVIEAMQFYTFKEVGRVSANTITFTHKNISADKTLSFRVMAVNGFNQSDYSNVVVSTTKKSITFSDLSSVSWAVEAINNLASRNVFDTKANSKFYPTQNITRGEYCSMLIRSLELNKVSAGKFADVTSKHKFYNEIMAASKLGIISADKNNKIYPDRLITREQAGIMAALALKTRGTPLPAQDGSILKKFADYKAISASSADNISAVCGAGILTGRDKDGKTYLQLGSYLTRAEAAVMIYKAMNLN
jgi:titin